MKVTPEYRDAAIVECFVERDALRSNNEELQKLLEQTESEKRQAQHSQSCNARLIDRICDILPVPKHSIGIGNVEQKLGEVIAKLNSETELKERYWKELGALRKAVAEREEEDKKHV